MRKSELKKLAKMLDEGESKEEILKAMEPNKRRDGHKVPPGGITLRAASRKYGIPLSTLAYRRQKGWIETLQETGNEIYVRESDIQKIKNALPKEIRRGSKEIVRYLEKSHATTNS